MVDGFDHLADPIQKSALIGWQLRFLVAPWQGHQPDAVVSEAFRRLFRR